MANTTYVIYPSGDGNQYSIYPHGDGPNLVTGTGALTASDSVISGSGNVTDGGSFVPLLQIDFDGLSNNQAVYGSGSVVDKRWDAVPNDNPFSDGYGTRASTAQAFSGKTSSCALTIAEGSTGYPGDGGIGGGFGGWINLASRGYAVSQGEHLWWRIRIYFPSDWSWARGDGSAEVKFYRMERTVEEGRRLDMYVLNGNYDWNIGNGESSSVPGSACAGYAFRNEVLVDNRTHEQTDFTTNLPPVLGQWNDIELYTYAHSDGSQAIRRMWVNGQFVREQVGDNVKWRDNNGDIRTRTIDGVPTLASSEDTLSHSFPFTYWNGGAPQDQTCYIQSMEFHKNPSDLPSVDEFGNPLIGTINL